MGLISAYLHERAEKAEAAMLEMIEVAGRADAEIEWLQVALRDIITNAENGNWTLPSSFANRARSALEQKAPDVKG